MKYFPLYGGSETHARLVCRSLQKLGHFVSVVTVKPEGHASTEVVDGVKITRVPRRGRSGFSGRLALVLALIDAFLVLIERRRDIDVIHLHGASILLIPGIAAALISRVPVVVKLATSGKVRGDFSIIQRSRVSRVQRWLLRKVDAFICLNSESEREILETLGSIRAEISQVSNCVDAKEFDRPGSLRRNEIKVALGIDCPEVALSVGRLEEGKGMDRVVDVWTRVVASRKDAMLLIVGDGTLGSQLRHNVKELQVDGNVRFVGAVADVRRYLWSADLFLLLSQDEGMSNALLEAMAASVAVVCSDNAANRAVVEGGTNGAIVAGDDTEETARCVLRLLNDAELRRRMAEQARRRIAERFDVNQVIREIENVYQRVAVKRR